MPRWPEYEPLYRALQEFLERCLVEDRSLLWNDSRAWTRENVTEVANRMVGSPLFGGNLSFEGKLRKQMEGAGPDHWRIVCDVYYVYYLPSSQMTLQNRRERIGWAAQQGGLAAPGGERIWLPQQGGFTHTGVKYHSKYAQFWLLLLFAQRVKEAPDRGELVRNPEKMQATLDAILGGIESKNDRAYDMRHAMLYLAFPDLYEPIISSGDKAQIIATYAQQVQVLPEDQDKALLAIREALGAKLIKDGRPYKYYEPEIREEWQPSRRAKTPVGKVRPTPPTPPDRDGHSIPAALEHTRNLILYGPPGTGKTYLAKRIAEALVAEQIEGPAPQEVAILRAIEPLTLHEILALGMYHAGSSGHYSVAEIAAHQAIALRLQSSAAQLPRNTIWSVLLTHVHPDSDTVGMSTRRAPYLFDKDQQSRWFLTETGREYVEQNLAGELDVLRAPGSQPVAVGDFVMWTTFHQSYSYEDFVEGLRPVSSEGQEGIAYKVVPGILRRICARAADDPEHDYVLVIDEINRGNIAKILGELITLLEDDKRAGEANALAVRLPYSQDEFAVPRNLYVIGTMNSTDRSIALLDVALRRRFAFVELMPQPELLDDATVESSESVLDLGKLLRSLNLRLRQYVDRDHQVGHSFLLQVKGAAEKDRVAALEFVWNNQIMPLLEEFFYAQRGKLAELLSPLWPDADMRPGEEASTEMDRLTGEDLVAALSRLAETPAADTEADGEA